jgi:hypothetical protein
MNKTNSDLFKYKVENDGKRDYVFIMGPTRKPISPKLT